LSLLQNHHPKIIEGADLTTVKHTQNSLILIRESSFDEYGSLFDQIHKNPSLKPYKYPWKISIERKERERTKEMGERQWRKREKGEEMINNETPSVKV